MGSLWHLSLSLALFIHAAGYSNVVAMEIRKVSSLRIKRFVTMESLATLAGTHSAVMGSTSAIHSLPPGLLSLNFVQPSVSLPRVRPPTRARPTTILDPIIPVTTATPVTARPVTSRPVTARPVTSRPVTARPVTSRPVTARPVTVRPVTSRPVTTRPVTVRPVTVRPVTSRPVTARPVTVRPVTSRPVTARPVTVRPVTVRPVTASSVTVRPVTSRPVTVRPVTARPVTVRAVTARPVTVQPVTARPTTEPVSSRPITKVKSVVQPSPSPPNALGCSGNFTSTSIPNSVHSLKVGDIKVVAAMGDSITAGNGARATNVFGVLTENRGRAFSIGGDMSYSQGLTTLPNILKVFNPQVYGYSVGSGGPQSLGSNLNIGRAGAVARDMPSQAVSLIAALMVDPKVNYTSDWKVVTILVGGNDLCNSCLNPHIHTSAVYKAGLERALDIMHERMPRTLVNLVEVFDINVVTHLARFNLLCGFVIGNICPCGVGRNANRPELRALALEYRRSIADLVSTGKYETRSDFTVVIQPFFSRLTLPRNQLGRTDFSYFAPDCFHLSEKGQRAAGKALWNNMMQPMTSKQTDLLPTSSTSCPTTEFIPTRLN